MFSNKPHLHVHIAPIRENIDPAICAYGHYRCTETGPCTLSGLHSIPAPCHSQTCSRPGTLSEQTPDVTEWTADLPSDAQSPANME